MASLTTKQRAFVEEYLVDFNATRAAERAGYVGNDATLATVGYENIRKPEIAKVISQRLSERAMLADEVLARLAEQARGTLSDFLEIHTSGVAGVDLKKAEEAGVLHLLKKFEYKKGEGIKIELYDAQAALDKLARAHGLYRPDDDLGSEEQPFVVKVLKGVSTDDL